MLYFSTIPYIGFVSLLLENEISLYYATKLLQEASACGLLEMTQGIQVKLPKWFFRSPSQLGWKERRLSLPSRPRCRREHLQDSERTLTSLQRKSGSFCSSSFESLRQIMVRRQIFAMACISVLAPHFGLGLSWVLLFTDIFQPLRPQAKLRHESHFNILDHTLGSMSEFSGSNSNCEWNLLGGGVSPPILGLFPQITSLSRNQ